MSSLVRVAALFGIGVMAAARGVSAAGRTDILFLLYDAGETYALQPVLQTLRQEHVRYKLLVMGTARDVVGNDPNVVDLNKDCGVEPLIDRVAWPRERAISEPEVGKAVLCVAPKAVVTGMASAVQRQISGAFRRAGVDVTGYYEALSAPSVDSISLAILPALDRLLVVSEPIAKEFRGIRSNLPIVVVGQPTLEKWALSSQRVDRKAVVERLGLNTKRKTVLYAGGYGDDYEEAFSIFAKAAASLNGYNIIVSLHPKVDGSLERRVIAEQNASNMSVIPKAISTMEAAVVADVVVCHRSTVGMQALFLGRPVIYVDSQPEKFKNPAIEFGWSRQIHDSNALISEINRGLETQVSVDFYRMAGIPRDSTRTIASVLKDVVVKSGGRIIGRDQPGSNLVQ